MLKKIEYKKIGEIINDYEVLLFDIWGVLGEEKSYSKAVEAVNFVSSAKKIYFVSNAPRLKNTIYDKLKKWGLSLSEEQIITSGEVFRSMIRESQKELFIDKPIIYNLGRDRNEEITIDLPCRLTDEVEEANIVLLSLYRDEGENLEEFDGLLEKVAKSNKLIMCANPDITVPHECKRYCAGYFAQKVEKFGGKVIYTGKPYAEIYKNVLKQHANIAKEKILMVGDSFNTDILGANNIGIHSALVLTGNARKIFDDNDNLNTIIDKVNLVAKQQEIFPNFIVDLCIV